MTDARELIPAATDRLTVRVRAVDAAAAPELWAAPTPCTAWSVRDLVAHLCFEHLWAPDVLAGESMDAVGDRYDGDLLADDPVGAWERAAAASGPAFAETAAHAGRVHTIFGWIAVAEYAEQMLLDLTVHEWDLARGAGLAEDLEPGNVERALTYARSHPVMLTGPGLFAPPVRTAGSTAREQLLLLLGRRPSWSPVPSRTSDGPSW